MQHRFHASFDTELTDPLGQNVGLVERIVELLLGDRPHVSDHVGGMGRVRIYAPGFGQDLDAGEVLNPFKDCDGGRFVNVFPDRHREERAVLVRVETSLHLLDRHVDPTRQALEDLLALRLAAQHLPVNRNRQNPFVVSQNPAMSVKNSATFGGQSNDSSLGLGHAFLELFCLDGLEEPQPNAQQGEQHHADKGENSEARSSAVNCHGSSLA